MGASGRERPQLRNPSSGERPRYKRNRRKFSGPRVRPAESGPKKVANFEEIDFSAALDAREWLSGIGGILRARQDAVNLFSQALTGGGTAIPPHAPFAPPRIAEFPRASQAPARKRAVAAERNRQLCGIVKTGLLDAGMLASRRLRYIVAGEVAGAWKELGGHRSSPSPKILRPRVDARMLRSQLGAARLVREEKPGREAECRRGSIARGWANA